MLLNAGRGSGVVARQQTRQLMALGHEVALMHPGIGDGVSGANNVEVTLPGSVVPVHEYLPSAGAQQKAVSSMTYDEARAFVPHYVQALEAVVSDVDIVIGHHGNLAALAVSEVCRAAGKPYVLFLHGTGVEPRHHGGYDDRLWDEIEGAILEAAGLLVTTDYVRDELVRNLVTLPEDRFLVLPCGVDLQEFGDTSGKAVGKFDLPPLYVICPGALTAVKGPQNVVTASKEYADLAPTVFLGNGELREELESQLGSRGAFLGFVSSEDKADLISNAGVLVAAPEKKEHFGIIYAEALAGGTPCVAYEGGGVASIVTPDVGILTPRTPKTLGTAIRRLLEDEGGRATMSQKARARAEQHYDARLLGISLGTWLESLT